MTTTCQITGDQLRRWRDSSYPKGLLKIRTSEVFFDDLNHSSSFCFSLFVGTWNLILGVMIQRDVLAPVTPDQLANSFANLFSSQRGQLSLNFTFEAAVTRVLLLHLALVGGVGS